MRANKMGIVDYITKKISMAIVNDILKPEFQKIGTRFEKIDTRFEKIDTMFEKINNKIDKIDNKVDNLAITVNDLNVRVATLETGFKHESEHAGTRGDLLLSRLEHHLDKLFNEKIKQLSS